MSDLSKKNRETTAHKGVSRSLNRNQLNNLEQSQFTSENGFTSEASEIASELSAAANKYNELKASGKRTPKITQLLNDKIRKLISQLEDLNYSVENIADGIYYVKPNDRVQLSHGQT